MMTRLIFIGVMISLAACGPGDLFDLPTSPGRITVLSFNSAGQPWAIIVSPSSPLSRGYVPAGLPEAIVSIYDNGNFVERLKLDTVNYRNTKYLASVFRSETNSPQAGHTYKIVVEAEGYPTATAEYIQPDPVAADITFDLRERKRVGFPHYYSGIGGNYLKYDSATRWTFDISLTFTDPPGDNYYDFWLDRASTEDSLGLQYLGQYLRKADHPVYDYILDGALIDDKDISGKQVTIKLGFVMDDYHPIAAFKTDLPNWFRVSLRTMTAEQYRYIIQTRKSQISNDDPYAQPITTFTNIENGLGIFGGFTPYSKTFYYKLE